MRSRSWTDAQLIVAVKSCFSYRCVIASLGLVPAGGNYEQVKTAVVSLGLDSSHFKGKGWNSGIKGGYAPRRSLPSVLVQNSNYQSFKLKKRLFREGIKKEACEECGWTKRNKEGYLPLELDHINGDRHDNRLENLRVLCPNCHSLKSTHRGRNKRK